MYSRARAYTCYARGTIGGRKKKKNTSIHATRISPSLRVRGRNEASNVRAMRPDNRRKRNGGTGEGGKRGRNTGCVIPRHRVFIVSRGRVQWASCSLLINAHSFLSFFLFLSLVFNFFFFYSARHEKEYIIPCISPRVRKKRRNYRGERIYPPLEGAIRNRTACISMNAFDQLPFILHQSSFASLLSILDSGDFNPSSYHSLVSS